MIVAPRLGSNSLDAHVPMVQPGLPVGVLVLDLWRFSMPS
jgi:hypothetical protein